MIRRTQTSLVFLFLCFNVILTFGQTVKGTVIDPQTSLPQPGMQLILEKTDHQSFTNGTGAFRFENIKAGTYNILAKVNEQFFIVSTFNMAESDIDLGALEFVPPSILSQEDISIIDLADLTGIEAENDNYSSALGASRDQFVNSAAYNLGSGRFRPRGYFNEDSEM